MKNVFILLFQVHFGIVVITLKKKGYFIFFFTYYKHLIINLEDLHSFWYNFIFLAFYEYIFNKI